MRGACPCYAPTRCDVPRPCWIAPFAGGLFTDSRVAILAEDGRHQLSAADATYDVIIGDLFVPWKRGNAALYSVEHFGNVAERLAPDGLFAQWVPLYQLSEREFGIVARTFTAVFPEVTLWRGDFLPEGPIVALVGRKTPRPLDVDDLLNRAGSLASIDRMAAAGQPKDSVLPDPQTPPLLLYYAGNLGQAADLFADYPLNTDDRPELQFSAPRSQRAQAAGLGTWFVGEPLIDMFARILERAPLGDDPFLADLTPQQREAAVAGLEIFRAQLAAGRGDEEEAAALLRQSSRRLAPPGRSDGEAAELRRALEDLRSERDAALEALERRIRDLQGG
jgi:spermidine synthase